MRYEMREDEYCHYFYDDVDGVDIKTNEDLLEVLNEQSAEIELLKIMLRSQQLGQALRFEKVEK